ncbi:hypothetical protein BKA82DRAFT_1003979 [Pisolithus tinctorius]|uniref:Uncharacterized protein n=1 Tax=Pisolithus tinctorius Marx 270 TaxID=870435 RepID=A0A0C3NYR8_PISTI|nr:hypothetical protein BKA82DRAFT_1003979 [Pisolithus tinctorius]KIO00284.1 hypothetical protein M404DRAFT_1003979 [Pisolithus tinctorius Marx 270]
MRSQLNTPFMVQEIRVLQAKLDAAGDDDEQRALGEDVTGKARMHQLVPFRH